MQTDHLPIYLDHNVEVIGVVDPSVGRTEIAQKMISGCRVYQSLSAALEAEPDVDFCDIGAPPYAHAFSIEKCVERGIPVICEKPFLMNTVELASVLDSISKHQVLVLPCHTWLYGPQMADAIKWLADSSHLGDPNSATIQILRTGPAQGIKDWIPSWRTRSEFSGGGILMDHGYHLLYLAQHLLQAYPIEVEVYHTRCKEDTDYEIFARVLLKSLEPDGHYKSLDAKLSWLAHERYTSYRVECDFGAISIEDSYTSVEMKAGNRQQFYGEDGLTYSSLHPKWFAGVFDYFLECYKSRNVFHKELLMSCYTTETIEACYRSQTLSGSQAVRTPWLSLFHENLFQKI